MVNVFYESFLNVVSYLSHVLPVLFVLEFLLLFLFALAYLCYRLVKFAFDLWRNK